MDALEIKIIKNFGRQLSLTKDIKEKDMRLFEESVEGAKETSLGEAETLWK